MQIMGLSHPRGGQRNWRAKSRRISLLPGIFALLLNPALGQPGPAVRLARLSGEIVLDGVINEAAWQAVAPFAMLESYPNFGNEPSERTDIRVAYDNDYLYAAGQFLAKDMSLVRATALERDDMRFTDESFGIVLDTFNDNENALVFVVNSAGNRTDMSVAGDAQAPDGPPWNRSWNTFWDVATVRSDSGWSVEVRIPFSSLRFEDHDGIVVMGLTIWRFMAGKNQNVTYPPIEPKWDWGFVKPSIAQDIILEDVHASRPLYITPYVLGGQSWQQSLNTGGTKYDLTEESQGNWGLDVKYGITSNLTLDATLFTDFAQVEADDQQVNLTRFSLFFPEKRLFFQERASIFEFSNGGPNRMFHSRRIGLSDYGPVPILAGSRLVGRIGAWDVGILDILTTDATFTEDDSLITIPAENFALGRLRRQVLNDYSYVGAMLTSRDNSAGNFSRAYGIDGIFRIWGDDYLEINLSQTISDTMPEAIPPADKAHLRIKFQRRGTVGGLFDFSLTRSGAHYAPGMGFQARNDFTRFGNRISYGILGAENSALYQAKANLDFSAFYRNSDGKLETGNLGISLDLNWKAGSFGNLRLVVKFENLTDTLRLPDDQNVPPGAYRFAELGGFYAMSFSRLIRTSVNFTLGPWYDGLWLTVGAGPSWTVSDHIRLSGQYQFTTASFPDREQGFSVHLVQLRLNANLNAKLSTATFVQINTAAGLAGINFRLRYNAREGNDFYLVYNEGLNLDRIGTPAPPFSANRTILIKYARTFLP